MNPFENINIPDNKDETSIECGSDLVTNINAYFEDNWRYLNQEDSQWILDRLRIDICYSQTRESFANLNTDMFENWINLVAGWIGEWSIQIDELENPKAQENISRLYGIQLADFQKALQYFIQKSNISLFQKNPNMRMLSSWDFQISAILENWEHHIVNFHPNWEVKSEHTF